MGSLVIRSAGAPNAVISAVQVVIKSMDATVTVKNAATVDQLYGADRAASAVTPRFYLLLMSAFAAVALSIAAIGIYGMLSYSVSRRIPEMGIRMAMGAEPAAIRRLVVRQALAPVLAGIGAGLLGAYWLTNLLRSVLYQVTPHDLLTLACVAAFMLLTAAAASYAPAHRATRVDPISALHVE